MTKITLSAGERKIVGRKVKNLRADGLIPANIFGKNIKSQSVQIKIKEFEEVFKKAGETGIITLVLGKDERPVLVHNVQVHPATGAILHIDFHEVNLKEKVNANIPVELIGESPVEKSGEGTVVLLVQELEVEALPADLPEKFEVDASKLTEVDQAVKVTDLDYDKEKVEVKADPESIVVKVEPPQKEEVIEVAPVAEEGAEGAPVAEGGESTEASASTEVTADKPKDQVPAEQK